MYHWIVSCACVNAESIVFTVHKEIFQIHMQLYIFVITRKQIDYTGQNSSAVWNKVAATKQKKIGGNVVRLLSIE